MAVGALDVHSECVSVVGFQPLCYLGDAGLVLGCQGFEQTHSPETFEFTHFSPGVQRKGVIVSESSELTVVGQNNFGIAQFEQFSFGSRLHFVVVPVASDFAELREPVLRKTELYPLRHRFAGRVILPLFDFHHTVPRVGFDLVSQEDGPFATRANVAFLFRYRQVKRLFHILLDLLAHPFGIRIGANDPDQIVVGVATIEESLVGFVKGVSAWEASPLGLEGFDRSLNVLKFTFSCLLSLQDFCLFSEASNGFCVPLIDFVSPAPFPLIELFFHVAHELVKFVQVNVGEDGRKHASYNVAKKVLEFEYQEEIPRYRLRAAYGDGFKGAPLWCQVSGEGTFPPDAATCDGQATQALASPPQEVPCSGGSHHV